VTKAQLERTVRVWQRRLGLDAWKIDVDFSDPASEGCVASTLRSNDYDTATITWDAGWASWEPLYANQTVVHELLHLLTRDVDLVVDDARDQLHPDASALVEKRYRHETEGLVDRLSVRLVDVGGLA
jgi:hypothetical protein